MNRKFHIKKGDLVQVNAGEDKGKQGKVLATSPKADTVTVEGVRMQKKHEKARKANETSKIVEKEGAISASNVMVICPECGKPKPAAAADGWTCTCGAVNKGKFCAECGKPKPAGVPQYKCDKCGWEPADPQHPPKFCPECGDPFDDGDIV